MSQLLRTIADLEGTRRRPRPPQQGRTSAYRNLDRPTYLGLGLCVFYQLDRKNWQAEYNILIYNTLIK